VTVLLHAAAACGGFLATLGTCPLLYPAITGYYPHICRTVSWHDSCFLFQQLHKTQLMPLVSAALQFRRPGLLPSIRPGCKNGQKIQRSNGVKGESMMVSRIVVLFLALLMVGSFAYADESIKDGGKEVGQGAKKIGKATGKATVKAGKATGKAIKKSGTATGKAFKDAGKETGEAFKEK
jgi:hypothetical protein